MDPSNIRLCGFLKIQLPTRHKLPSLVPSSTSPFPEQPRLKNGELWWNGDRPQTKKFNFGSKSFGWNRGFKTKMKNSPWGETWKESLAQASNDISAAWGESCSTDNSWIVGHWLYLKKRASPGLFFNLVSSFLLYNTMQLTMLIKFVSGLEPRISGVGTRKGPLCQLRHHHGPRSLAFIHPSCTFS